MELIFLIVSDMPIEKLPNGNLLVPKRAEGPHGEIGDGVEEIGPDHSDYEGWLRIFNLQSGNF